jgi:hypothetical protein
MADPVVKVELGVNLAQSDTAGFELGDAVRGVLDNTAYTLSGLRFYDITNLETLYACQKRSLFEF